MKQLEKLFDDLDLVRQADSRLSILKEYLQSTPPEDLAWTLYFFENRRLSTRAGSAMLKQLLQAQTPWTDRVIEQTYQQVKDLPETLALLLPANEQSCDLSLSSVVVQFLLPLARFSQHARGETIRCAWQTMSTSQRVLFNKMLLGGLRSPVPLELWYRALSRWSGLPEPVVAHRLRQPWKPSATQVINLFKPRPQEDQDLMPYSLAGLGMEVLGPTPIESGSGDTLVALKQGVRAQMIRRKYACELWSETKEPIGMQFPELLAAAHWLPSGTVIEGVIVEQAIAGPTKPKRQKDLGCQMFLAHDLLEHQGQCLMDVAWHKRAHGLTTLLEQWQDTWSRQQTLGGSSEMNPDCVQQEMFQDEVMASEEASQPPIDFPIQWCERREQWDPEAPSLRPGQESRQWLIKGDQELYPDPSLSVGWRVFYPQARTACLVLKGAIRGDGEGEQAFSDYLFAAQDEQELVWVGQTQDGWSHPELGDLAAWVREHRESQKGPLTTVKPRRRYRVRFLAVRPSARAASGLRLEGLKVLQEISDPASLATTSVNELKSLLED